MVSRKARTLKHPLAVLRKMLGLGQQRLAEMTGRSRIGIQRVERGTLPLSEKLAERISHETWVSAQWLMDGNPEAAPWLRNHTDIPYRKEHYERLRFCLLKKEVPSVAKITGNKPPEPPPGKPLAYLTAAVPKRPEDEWLPHLPAVLSRIFSALYAAGENGGGELAFYKLSRFADAIKADYGQYGNRDEPGNRQDTAFREFCKKVLATLGQEDALVRAVCTPTSAVPSNVSSSEPVRFAEVKTDWTTIWAKQVAKKKIVEDPGFLERDLKNNPRRAPDW